MIELVVVIAFILLVLFMISYFLYRQDKTSITVAEKKAIEKQAEIKNEAKKIDDAVTNADLDIVIDDANKRFGH